jgi:hypothetical protein
MTLLDRLLSACQTTASCNNYVDQPYLLQIDFLANPMEADQFGAKGHVIDSKRIPIKFTEFKIKPGAGGTNYFVKAMPYNHLGFVQSVAAVPTTLSVTAKTVGEYFDSTVKDLALLFRDAAAVVQQQRIETEINKLDIGSISEEELLSLKERLKAELSNVNSFPNGYNTWYRNAANQAKRSDVPLNLILFAIDPDIAKSLIVDVEKSESKRGVFASPIYSALAGTATASAGPDFKNKSVFSVLAGTSVIEVINRIVSASEYIKGQIKNAQTEAEKTSGSDITTSDADARTVSAAGYNKLSTPNQTKKIEYKPTDWFKIIPTIYLGKFDLRTNSYSKAILYTILKYNAANAYHPDMALTKIPPAQVVRTYNYYYTGLNQDIINLDIDFDATFVTGIATFTKQIESSTTVAGADKPKEKAPPEPASQPFASTPYAKSVLTPLNSQANPQNQTAEDYSVSSVSRSLYSAYPRGDMLNIRMKIVGDPAFIKQDDIYHNPVQDGYGAVINKVKAPGAPPINEQGQIIFDHEEVYVQILVKSAVDIDDATGITNKTVKLSNGQVANGTFSGLYKIMTVESEFKQGKFEQTLSLIRMPDSMLDNATGTTNNNGGAVVSTATSTAQSDAVPGVKPAATVTTSPVARDATLTGIANGSATSPVPAVAGAGTTAAPNQPSTAAAANVNATQVNIQQQPTPNSTNGIQDFAAIEQEVKILDAQTEAANAQFRAELKKIENNDELTQVEKNKQERALLDERGDALFRAQLGYSRLNTKLGKIIAKMAKVNTFGPEASLERGLQDRVDNVKNDITNNYYAIDRNRRR